MPSLGWPSNPCLADKGRMLHAIHEHGGCCNWQTSRTLLALAETGPVRIGAALSHETVRAVNTRTPLWVFHHAAARATRPPANDVELISDTSDGEQGPPVEAVCVDPAPPVRGHVERVHGRGRGGAPPGVPVDPEKEQPGSPTGHTDYLPIEMRPPCSRRTCGFVAVGARAITVEPSPVSPIGRLFSFPCVIFLQNS
jgi:hypothetical protein